MYGSTILKLNYNNLSKTYAIWIYEDMHFVEHKE